MSNQFTPKQIEGFREAYRQWPHNYIRDISDAGEGFLVNAVTQNRPCGCRVTGNGTIQFPLTVIPCARCAAAPALYEALIGLLPYLSTEAQLLDYASLNEGQASSFDVASVKARAALALVEAAQ